MDKEKCLSCEKRYQQTQIFAHIVAKSRSQCATAG